MFTDAQLRALERSPRRQIEDAIDAGDAAALTKVATSIERSFVGTLVGTRNWITHTMGYAASAGPPSLLGELVDATHRCFALHPEPVDTGDTTASVTAELVALAGRGQREAAVAVFDLMEHQWRARQDFARDWLSYLLSHVYRAHGLAELERALRHAADRTLFDWMPVDVGRAPERRLPTWVRMLQGHWSDLRIEEDDEKFTLVQDPCGTCTRQIAQGRYDGPLELAIVEEVAPATWHRGATPVYRVHVPVWHVELAREVLGVPWPVNQCPAGMGTGPCPVLIYKDPRDPHAEERVPDGRGAGGPR